ncbi:MAG TPA: divalent-cation tolerance protein CutA [Planctomycetota bacterium]|nr:divalent-cation tolerance protein CutA [Planctomycetota bacterium]
MASKPKRRTKRATKAKAAKGKRPNPIQVVMVTAPEKDAQKIAKILVKERLIACANLLPGVQSLYWWKSKIDHGTETVMLLKTVTSKVPKLLKRVQKLHPYSIPEFIAVDVQSGATNYLKWVHDECR